MTYQLNNIYTFNNEYETVLDLSSQPSNHPNIIPSNSDIPSQTNENQTHQQLSYWRPSSKLQRLYNRFQNNILTQ